MDLRKIKKLIELVEESGISELEVKSGDEAVRIARPNPGGSPGVAPAELPANSPAPANIPRQVEGAVVEVRAPMAGTFYVAAEPGAPAFVSVGQTVAAESVVCIIESMKMMNEIRLEQAGECLEVLAGNGEPVSARQLLFRFRAQV